MNFLLENLINSQFVVLDENTVYTAPKPLLQKSKKEKYKTIVASLQLRKIYR